MSPNPPRTALETAVGAIAMTGASLTNAHLNPAVIMQEHGAIIADRHGFANPIKLEHAVLAHVADERTRIGISPHIG